ncbi:uncharacterized protein LOC124449766 isoform X2 [Xenia sp. Carnegie-2017]|uniref:uncharacterized protein LOC124449766 isoform X2 n=1 Tax=Xenia sp. Carnegie-2017 TaxID=2897299 RepID=UPI001F037C0A|nr:uncharacterized protein LOC124449766 isoform X2 [Xenia sp. Carnegie-2017]
METDIKWEDLTKVQRNILMWPDLLTWNKPVEHVIKRNTPDSKLGLKTRSFEDKSTNTWYHIVSHVEKNSPAANANITSYQWITNLSDKDTRNLEHSEFTKILSNKETKFKVYTRKPVDAMTCFGSEWPGESNSKVVTFKIKKTKEFKKKLNLAHFYSKERECEEKDSILIWEIGQFSYKEMKEPLKRGDRLLEVDGQAVANKKLIDIYEIFRKAFPGKTEVKITKMRHCPSNEIKRENTINDKEQLNNPEPVKNNSELNGQGNNEQKCNPSPEVFPNSDQEDEKAKNVGMNEVKKIESKNNGGYASTPKSKRKPTADNSKNLRHNSDKPQKMSEKETDSHAGQNNAVKVCESCNNEDALTQDRNLWQIEKIDHASITEICDYLDDEGLNAKDIASALDCFTQHEVTTMKKHCQRDKTSFARIAIKKWAAKKPYKNNVDALKRVVNVMKRNDVIKLIEKWEEKLVCQACGRPL